MEKHKNKWSGVVENSTGLGNSYLPQYAKNSSAKYSPKRTVRSFRDLEVYQTMMECSIIVAAEVLPILKKDKYPLVEGMQNCSLAIPLLIAEAHSQRFSNFSKAVQTLENAMQGCNKMIVYLEQGGALANNLDIKLADELSKRYLKTRGKMLRLEKSWQKFYKTDN